MSGPIYFGPTPPASTDDAPKQETAASGRSFRKSPPNRPRRPWQGTSFNHTSKASPDPDIHSLKIKTPDNPTADQISVYRARGWIDAAEAAGFKINAYGQHQTVEPTGRPANPFLGQGYLEFEHGRMEFERVHSSLEKTKKQKKSSRISSVGATIFSLLDPKVRSYKEAQERVLASESETTSTPGP
jgi:hypothetical protein